MAADLIQIMFRRPGNYQLTAWSHILIREKAGRTNLFMFRVAIPFPVTDNFVMSQLLVSLYCQSAIETGL